MTAHNGEDLSVDEIMSSSQLRVFLAELDDEITRAILTSSSYGGEGKHELQTMIAHYVDGLRFTQRKLSSMLRLNVQNTNTIHTKR